MKRHGPDHPKTKALGRRMPSGRSHAVGTLEMLWHWAARHAPRGDVGRFKDADLAEAVDWTGNPAELVRLLVEQRWLDEHSDCEIRLVIHDWADHAEDSVHMQLARARQFFACGTAPRLKRLSGKERAEAEEWYRTHCAHGVRTACARCAHGVRTACAPPPPPPPPMPSRGEEHTAPGGASPPAAREGKKPPARKRAATHGNGAAPPSPPVDPPDLGDAFFAQLAAQNPLGVPVTADEARAWFRLKWPLMRERGVKQPRRMAVRWWARLTREELAAARRYLENSRLRDRAEALEREPVPELSDDEVEAMLGELKGRSL